MCVVFALAVMMIAGAFASAPAMAHAGHSHAAPVAADPAPMSADEALALSGLASLADPAPDAAPAGSADSRGPAPCDGHCCTVGGSHCCSFAPPLALHAATPALAIDPRGPPAGDLVRDGRDPDSLLRPPKSFA